MREAANERRQSPSRDRAPAPASRGKDAHADARRGARHWLEAERKTIRAIVEIVVNAVNEDAKRGMLEGILDTLKEDG